MRIHGILILVLCFITVFIGNSYSGSLEELKSLPYLAWSDKPDSRPSGIVQYDKNRVFDGYNLYVDESTGRANLMDMRGHIVYRWELPSTSADESWDYVRILNDGSIVAVSPGRSFAKLDRDSKLMWETPISADHDIEIYLDGTYLVQAIEPPVAYKNRYVVFDSIDHISKDGQILDKWSTKDHLQELQKIHFPSFLDRNEKDGIEKKEIHRRHSLTFEARLIARKWYYDYYHLNSIQILPQTVLGLKDRRFQKGNWLICLRNVDLICILDKDTKKIVWHWGPGILDWPHMPRMLNNGNILVYDNGFHRRYSRLLIIDPGTDKIVWEYKANPPRYFYSNTRGSSQLLANGNFFICEARHGRAFEITPQGEIVWEFLNPVKDEKGEREVISRMIRISKEEVSGWLKEGYKN